MAIATKASFFVASALTLIVFAGMQIFKNELGSGRLMTIVGGLAASHLFVFLLTAISNLERVLFGSGFQTKIIPEVASCLLIAMFAAGLVHRVCVTTCFIFSIAALYYLNNLSSQRYNVVTPQSKPVSKSRKGQ